MYSVLNTDCLCVQNIPHPPHLQTHRYSTVTLFTNTHNQTPQLLIDSKASLFPSVQQFDSAINPIHNYLQFAGSLSNCHLNSREGDIPPMSLQMLLLPEGRNGTPSEPSNVRAVSYIGQRAVAWCSGSQHLLTSSDLRNYRPPHRITRRDALRCQQTLLRQNCDTTCSCVLWRHSATHS